MTKDNILQYTRYYMGDRTYEMEEQANGMVIQRTHLGGDASTATSIYQRNGDGWYPLDICRDYLGTAVNMIDVDGSAKHPRSFDAWGYSRNYMNFNLFADGRGEDPLADRGFCGHEHLLEFGLINMNARLYDPVLGRFLSPDPFVQDPFFSQSYNRYAYCMNNPLMFTDPEGYWFGIDDAVVAVAGFAFGYVSHGITTGNWGWQAVTSGGMGALAGWLGYNTCGLSTAAWAPGQGITSTTFNYVGSMAINSVASQIIPPMNIPITNNFSLSISPAFGIGANGLIGGFNFAGTYHDGNFSFSAGAGIGSTGYTLFGGGSWSDGTNSFSYYASYFGGGEDNQWVGGIRYGYKDFSFRLESDFFTRSGDRWRTAAAEIGYKDFVLGFNVYTNDPKGEAIAAGKDPKDAVRRPGNSRIWGPNTGDLGEWDNGQVYRAPAYIGIRNGHQVTRFGYSHPGIQDFTQNGIHRYFPPGRQNYYTGYDNFEGGKNGSWYGYSGYYNPFTLY